MQKIIKPIAAIFSLSIAMLLLAATKPTSKATQPAAPKIQVAILLDVSNSMDGLIEQAKAQLWNMVNVLGKAKCNEIAPNIEIALYEYGRSNNDVQKGYVKQINGFIANLDSLSENLFKLTTNGGDEYCGQVIFNSIKELQWDAAKESYKVIFIAGNEDFLQGNLKYTEACNKAREKGVIVNTIYCGDKMQGEKEHWNLGAECGTGSFTNINSNAVLEDIKTPYDSTMYVLNTKLNGSYVTYNYLGASAQAKQVRMDAENISMNNNVGIQRAVAKANGAIYYNGDWDLVDAYLKDKKALDKVDIKALPDSLKTKTKAELEAIVQLKSKERALVQEEINTLNTKREAYLVEERKRRAAINNEPTLETEVEKIIKQQAKRFNMKIG
jgi:hypothetical protein